MSSDLWACTHIIFDKTKGQNCLFLGVAETIIGSLCFVVWVLFRVFSIFCNLVFVNRIRLQHQETAQKRPS